MCQHSTWLILSVLCIESAFSYWLSQSRMTWDDARTFCQSRCQSDLASIHSADDATAIQNLINDETYITIEADSDVKRTRIWIGLHILSESTWGWSDGSLFDWNGVESLQDNGNNDCAQWETTYGGWRAETCTWDYRFLCNECEGVLDKFFLHSLLYDYTDALNICENDVNTSLASIHNDDDMNSASYLCINNDLPSCWIGLTQIGKNTNTWEWSDGTYFDFGIDVSGGVYPWRDQKPNTGESCVVLKDGYNDVFCKDGKRFICNKPNEFCYSNHWQIMSSNNNVSFSNCMFYSSNDSITVIKNRKWGKKNFPLQMEYIFEINDIYQNMAQSEVGLVIVHEDNSLNYDICDSIFVGLSFQSDDAFFKFSTPYKDYNINISIDQSIYHRLNVNLVNNSDGVLVLLAQLDNTSFVPFVVSNSVQNGLLSLSKTIGIKNINTNTKSKSLFISGTPQYGFVNVNITSDCPSVTTSEPIQHSTTEITMNNTMNPLFTTIKSTFDSTVSSQGSITSKVQLYDDAERTEASPNDESPETSSNLQGNDSLWVYYVYVIGGFAGFIICNCVLIMFYIRHRLNEAKNMVMKVVDRIKSVDNVGEKSISNNEAVIMVNSDDEHRMIELLEVEDKIVTEGKEELANMADDEFVVEPDSSDDRDETMKHVTDVTVEGEDQDVELEYGETMDVKMDHNIISKTHYH